MDKLRSDIKGGPLGPMSFFFSDSRCPIDMVGVTAWSGLNDKLAKEVAKS
jgi:hypothetical protein